MGVITSQRLGIQDGEAYPRDGSLWKRCRQNPVSCGGDRDDIQFKCKGEGEQEEHGKDPAFV